jgi:hypothetical protein
VLPGGEAASVVLLDRTPAGDLLLVAQTPFGSVMYGSAADVIEWKELARDEADDMAAIKPGFIFKPRRLMPRTKAALAKDRLVVYTPATGRLSIYNSRAKSWQVRDAPLDFTSMVGHTNGTFSASEGNYNVVSTDQGATWWNSDKFGASELPVFADRQRGYVLAGERSLIGASPAKQLHRTVDGGKTWTVVGLAPPSYGRSWGGRLILDESGKRVGMRYGDARTEWSDDEGKTWR